MQSRYDDIHASSLAGPGLFWEQAAEEISWFRRWDAVFDASRSPFPRWFGGGLLNTCHNV
ncbi:MAG: prpE [Microvirga sp.]|jgi:propionyl-CoA synthetase|nr:prpE [Microvirga sp.]